MDLPFSVTLNKSERDCANAQNNNADKFQRTDVVVIDNKTVELVMDNMNNFFKYPVSGGWLSVLCSGHEIKISTFFITFNLPTELDKRTWKMHGPGFYT